MRTALFVLFCLMAGTAVAASPLQGQWRVAADSLPNYVGIVLIDSENRATWDSPDDRDRVASFRGYISRLQPPVIEATFTNGIRVTRMHCVMQSSDLLHCRNTYADQSSSAVFTLTRVGPGPTNLLSLK